MEDWRKIRNDFDRSQASRQEKSRKLTGKNYDDHKFRMDMGLQTFFREKNIHWNEFAKEFIEEEIFNEQINWQH